MKMRSADMPSVAVRGYLRSIPKGASYVTTRCTVEKTVVSYHFNGQKVEKEFPPEPIILTARRWRRNSHQSQELMDRTTDIKIVRMERLARGSNLKAFVDVKIGEITIIDCRVIQQPGQKAYLSGPQKPIEGGRWAPIVKMSAALRQCVQEAVLKEAERYGIIEKPEARRDLLLEHL